MSYSCLVGSFLNSTTATRPDPTRLVGDPGRRPRSPTKSGRVAVVGFSLKRVYYFVNVYLN